MTDILATNISDHLLYKARMIVITNACNLCCGGCNQLIGHFTKDKIWFIGLDDLQQQITLLKRFPNTQQPQITIFGGEPTLHPKWPDIVNILKSHSPTLFWINSNGRLGHHRYQREDNLSWYVDLHPPNQKFVSTLYAAADAVKLPDDLAYWHKAQKDCMIWKGCQSAIYNNKAYFCETGAAIDWLYNDGTNGWDIHPDTHPFIRTEQEIDEQARHICKRCAWCVEEIVPRQLGSDKSKISPYNQTSNTKHALTIIEPEHTSTWTIYDATKSTPSIGVYYIGQPKMPLSEWSGVTYEQSNDPQIALSEGRRKYDWTIILRSTHTIPNKAFSSLISKLSTQDERLYVSVPIYDMYEYEYDPDMDEPTTRPLEVLLCYHKDSTEAYGDELLSKLGHRKHMEGYGRAALWHDRLTSIAGGIINLVDAPRLN